MEECIPLHSSQMCAVKHHLRRLGKCFSLEQIVNVLAVNARLFTTTFSSPSALLDSGTLIFSFSYAV